MAGASWPVPFEKLLKVKTATAINAKASAMDLNASLYVEGPITADAVALTMEVTSSSEMQTATVTFNGAMNANQINAKMNSK